MMPLIGRIMLAIGGSAAASIVAKITITTALGLICARRARGNCAAVRHALLAATLGVAFVLPIASVVAPPVPVSVPILDESRIAPTAAAETRVALRSATARGQGVRERAGIPRAGRVSLSALWMMGWAAGGALALIPMIMGLWQVRGLRRSALPWPHGQAVVESLAGVAGVRKRVAVLLHGALPGPMTCGVVHSAIVLPTDAQTWEVEDLNRAMVHELEHVRRGDWASQCAARAIGAAYWFHPLIWIARRQLLLEAERSCDDAVLERSEATAYANQLVGLAKRLSATQRSPLLAMANRADLSARVGAVLDARQRRGRAGIFALAFTGAAAVALVTAVSPLRPVAATPKAAPAQTVATPRSDAGLVSTVNSNRAGEPREKPGPVRLVAQAQPARTPQSQATAAPRLLSLFFDLNSVDAERLERGRESAIQFVQNQVRPGDRISVMTFTSKLNVLEDFTDNRERILGALRTITPADAGNKGAANGIAGAVFTTFAADRLLSALQNAVELLAALPEKKALFYFSGVSGMGADNQAQLRATIDAALRANVAFYVLDPRGPAPAPK